MAVESDSVLPIHTIKLTNDDSTSVHDGEPKGLAIAISVATKSTKSTAKAKRATSTTLDENDDGGDGDDGGVGSGASTDLFSIARRRTDKRRTRLTQYLHTHGLRHAIAGTGRIAFGPEETLKTLFRYGAKPTTTTTTTTNTKASNSTDSDNCSVTGTGNSGLTTIGSDQTKKPQPTSKDNKRQTSQQSSSSSSSSSSTGSQLFTPLNKREAREEAIVKASLEVGRTAAMARMQTWGEEWAEVCKR
jgi:hypothetical protein